MCACCVCVWCRRAAVPPCRERARARAPTVPLGVMKSASNSSSSFSGTCAMNALFDVPVRQKSENVRTSEVHWPTKCVVHTCGWGADECGAPTYFCGLGEGLRSRCSCERELGIISTGKRARRTSTGAPLGRAARRPDPSALERGALIRPLARGASDTSKGAQTSSPLAKIEASLRHEGAAVHCSGVAFRSESMHACMF